MGLSFSDSITAATCTDTINFSAATAGGDVSTWIALGIAYTGTLLRAYRFTGIQESSCLNFVLDGTSGGLNLSQGNTGN